MNPRLFQFASMFSLLAFAIGCGSPTAENNGNPAAENNQTEPAPTVALANTVCPIMGGAVNVELTADWNGKTIGFCCEECLPEWTKFSDDEKTEKLASAGDEAHGEHMHGDHDHGDGHKGDGEETS